MAAFAGCNALENSSSERNDDTTGSADECTVTNSVGDAPAIPVQADGTFEDATDAIPLRWNVRAQNTVKESADDSIYYESDEDKTYLIFKFELTNDTDAVVTVDRFNFSLHLKTPNTVDEIGPAITGLDDIDVQIRPGGTVQGHLAFIVPSNTTEATLRADRANFPDRTVLAFNPNCDESLQIEWPIVNP